MVKHRRVDTTFQPTQCRVTLAVEMPFLLRLVVRKSLEVLQGERKHGQGPSNGTGSRAPRLVGGHEGKCATSARAVVLDTPRSFVPEKDTRLERRRMVMASRAIQQQARLWHTARESASDDVARSHGEKQGGPVLSPAGGANTPNDGSVVVVGEAEQTARSFSGVEMEMDRTIRPREKRIQSFSEADTLSCGSCVVEGEAELATQLSDERAQSL